MSNFTFTKATEVRLTLYNEVYVQQAMALVYQHTELSEVLKLHMQVTEGQEPVGEPQQLDPVVQAAIKPVDKRAAFQHLYPVRGSIHPMPHLHLV